MKSSIWKTIRLTPPGHTFWFGVNGLFTMQANPTDSADALLCGIGHERQPLPWPREGTCDSYCCIAVTPLGELKICKTPTAR